MKILLTGASGQLGQELCPRLRKLGELTTVDRQPASDGADINLKLDLADLNQVEIMLNRLGPDVIVNAAAYTAVDLAESESAAAFRVNAELPGCIAKWAARNDRLVFHYSTDYVFNGASERPYREQDPTSPLNVYGESKLAGEWAIQSSDCRHVILRTSWVYSAHGNNFVLSMLRLARERPELKIVSDQLGCPTWARNLARVSGQVLEAMLRAAPGAAPGAGGLYHYCDGDETNWFDFAATIFRLAHDTGLLKQMPVMSAVSSEQFQQVAERPHYSVLDTSAIRAAFGVQPASLERSLQKCLEELKT